MAATYDLHLHSCWSYDALAEPELYFRRARELSVGCIAVADHHNYDAAEEVRALAAAYPGVRVISAVEFSVTVSCGAVDLLCYNLPATPPPALRQALDLCRGWQRQAGAAISRGMQASGYDYTEADRLALLQSYRPARVIARQGATHVKGGIERDYFLRRGFIARPEDYAALSQRVREAGSYPPYPPVEQIVPAVRAAGGLVVIAHPTNYFLNNDLRRMDRLRAECSLDGIECAHRKIPPELTAFYRTYCREHGLVSTGGSDCHEPADLNTPCPSDGYTSARGFACHLGEPAWLDEFLERCRP